MKYLSETAARSALAKFLNSGSRAQKAFVNSLPFEVAGKGDFTVEEEHRTDHGKRIDILLLRGAVAVILELKIRHRENPFQYIGYRRYAERKGWRPIIIGISSNPNRTRGRERLNTAINEELTDVRLSWGNLVANLGTSVEALVLRQKLRSISPSLLKNHPSPDRSSIAEWDISLVDQIPEHLTKFFSEFIRFLPDNMSAYPDQAGSSPPLLRFGRRQWADSVGDNDRERLYLEVDIPRPSKPLPETQFHFGLTVWNHSTAGSNNSPKLNQLLRITERLAEEGFTFQRNRPFRYQPETWHPSLNLEMKGFRYLNASDAENFLLVRSEAVAVGTSNSMKRLSHRASQLVEMIDKVFR